MIKIIQFLSVSVFLVHITEILYIAFNIRFSEANILSSRYTKMGFAGNTEPQYIIPTGKCVFSWS